MFPKLNLKKKLLNQPEQSQSEKHPFHEYKNSVELVMNPSENLRSKEKPFREKIPELMSEPMETPESNQEEFSEGSSAEEASSIDEPSHFDHLIGDQEAKEQAQEVAQASSKFLPKKDWVEGLIEMHGLASFATGIKSVALPNGHVSVEQARHLFGMWYDEILKVRFLQFLLLPGANLLALLSSTAMYVLGMKAAIDEELAARRPAKRGGGNQGGGFQADLDAAKPLREMAQEQG